MLLSHGLGMLVRAGGRSFFMCILCTCISDDIDIAGNLPPVRRRHGRYRVAEQATTLNLTEGDPFRFLAEASRRVTARNSKPLILGISIIAHDASLALTLGGKVLGVIELERLHKRRYFDFFWMTSRLFPIENMTSEEAATAFEQAVVSFVRPALAQLCTIAVRQLFPQLEVPSPCTVKYDAVVIADPRTDILYVEALQRDIKAAEWIHVDHHHSHAAIGWLDSPFYHSLANEDHVTLIVSYDGWGNDGTLRMFTARSGNATLTPVGHAKRKLSYGFHYDISALVVRDLAWGSPYGSKPPCSYAENPACKLALPGSFMAFAAVGVSRDEWRPGAKLLLTLGIWEDALWPSPHGGVCELVPLQLTGWNVLRGGARYFSCNGADEDSSRQLDRDFAATVQAVFEMVVVSDVRSRLLSLEGRTPTSLVVSGGCALNVKVNSALARGLDLPTHVPPAPGDNGLALGAAWLLMPPPPIEGMQSIQFAGSPLTFNDVLVDSVMLKKWAEVLHATKIEHTRQLADLLLNGAIVGVARGRAEFGPRALGHRSLLSTAHSADLKDRLNQLKHRRWYRPCAPIVAAEDLEKVFEPGPDLTLGTPYMSFAPPLRPWVKKWLPAMAHLDNTARPQGVRRADDPWMHSLLVEVRTAMSEWPLRRRCDASGNSFYGACDDAIAADDHPPPAVGVLINTSLNPKGMPISNDIGDILLMFCAPGGDELDFVLLEEKWLFDRAAVVEGGLCGVWVQDVSASKSDMRQSDSSPDNLPVI